MIPASHLSGIDVARKGGPTGWRSVAASALQKLLSKTDDLAREAVNCNHPSDTPYVGTAETALIVASSNTIVPRQR